jgi:glutaredoxin-like YruB-family protein
MAKKIIVYSTNTCPYCDMVKDFLKQQKVSFEDINVAEDSEKAKEMVAKSGQMGVPVVDIDGEIIVGFNQQKIQELLNK